MSKSSTSTPTSKPAKPRQDFPLFPHARGYWAKKVHGRMYYFGPWTDPEGAEAEWDRQKADLLAGRKPRPKVEGVTVARVVNEFLTAKTLSRDAGEMTDRSLADYHTTCANIVAQFGRERVVVDLGPDDFRGFRATLAKKRSPVTLGNEIQRVRSVFKYAWDNRLIPEPVNFGTEFKKPKPKEIRLHRAGLAPRFLEPAEIRALLDAAAPQMRAMILLAINTGMGNTDIAELNRRHLDLEGGWLDYPRPKTGIERRAALWPETVKAIRAALKVRPKHKSTEDEEAVFITKYGERWKRSEAVTVNTGQRERVRRRETDAVGLQFGKLLRKVTVKRGRKKVSIKQEGDRVNFYALRHVFQTIAEETGDFPAVERVMGHEDSGRMSTHYRVWRRDDREDSRLRAVAEHVHAWLHEKPKR